MRMIGDKFDKPADQSLEWNKVVPVAAKERIRIATENTHFKILTRR